MRAREDRFQFVGYADQGVILAGRICAAAGQAIGWTSLRRDKVVPSGSRHVVACQVSWGRKESARASHEDEDEYLISLDFDATPPWIGRFRGTRGRILVNSASASRLGATQAAGDGRRLLDALRQWTGVVDFVDAGIRARRIGADVLTGLVMLGALSRYLSIDALVWNMAIEAHVGSRLAGVGRLAFWEGRSQDVWIAPSLLPMNSRPWESA